MQVLQKQGRASLFTRRHIASGAIIATTMIGLGVGIYMLRTVRAHHSSVEDRLDTLQHIDLDSDLALSWSTVRPSVFGLVYSFSYYFRNHLDAPADPTMGTVMFAAPLSLLGIDGAQRGGFESFKVEERVESNVYSMLRPPIDDFGLVGSQIFWVGLGLMQGFAFAKCRQGVPLAAMFFSWYCVDTFIGGFFFRYNSIVLGYILVGFVLWKFVRVRTTVPPAVTSDGGPAVRITVPGIGVSQDCREN